GVIPSHFNAYQSSYKNPQFQQQFSPSQSPQYGSIHPTQHYSTSYPSTPREITYPSTSHPNAYSSTIHQDAGPQPQFIPQIEYTVSIVNQQTYLAEFPQIDSGLAVLVFKQGDDPIDAINKMISFLSTVTIEQAAILREIVEQDKSLKPLDSASYSAFKYVKLIQELLGYVKDTCLAIQKPSEKLVVVTPINKNKTVRNIRTYNGTEFVNQTLRSYYDSVCISHETSAARSSQQNVVVAPRAVDLVDSPVSTSIDQDDPSTSIPSTQDQEHFTIISHGFDESPKTPHFHNDPLHEDSTS
nr:hypothetical protein [Tanacetum cinerariifolium]